jgi:hypothetical protein
MEGTRGIPSTLMYLEDINNRKALKQAISSQVSDIEKVKFNKKEQEIKATFKGEKWYLHYPIKNYSTADEIQAEFNIDIAFTKIRKLMQDNVLTSPIPFEIGSTDINEVKVFFKKNDRNRVVTFPLGNPDSIYQEDSQTNNRFVNFQKMIQKVVEEYDKIDVLRGAMSKGSTPNHDELEKCKKDPKAWEAYSAVAVPSLSLNK